MDSPLSTTPPPDSISEVNAPQFAIDCAETVVLEVGNHVYKTTIGTLKKTPNTYFSAMLSGKYPLLRQPDGSFFIDRDGQHFGSILSFMRSGYLSKPKDKRECKEILLEAEYYCVKEAIMNAWVRFSDSGTNSRARFNLSSFSSPKTLCISLTLALPA